MNAQVYSVPGQTEGRRKAFLEWTSIDLSSKLSLTCGGNVIKVLIIIFLLFLWEKETTCQFSKQISKLSFQLSVQVYSLLGKTEGKMKAFFGGCKKGSHIVRLPPRALGCHKRWKSLSFCEIWNNPTPPLFFIRPPYK